ncbi:GntR family transcriptional regulator [Streptomyces sp. NPDC048405]|uniref:GntR family transcriptional regulator n=1 Tax=unclassified Streptomyces TaxID=2593676 RepID=UPI001E45ECD4|nr:winged helix-turn-helix domain-containing protein [Streptomyces sp. HB-N217]
MPPKNTRPKYRQIANYLREGILDGTFAAGQPLPSEEALAKQCGVTRPTVSQGLRGLRTSGLVEAIMGRGTSARSPTANPATRALLREARTSATTCRHCCAADTPSR